MNFTNKGAPLSDQGMKNICTTLGIAQAEVWAVLTVETRGFGFLEDRRPQILFERHIFHKLTNGKHDAGNEDISNVKPGGYVGGTGEYPRLQKAMALDHDAALQSASWGIGQVMGFNFKDVGFSDINSMVTDMVKGENEQLLAMANFIKDKNLDGALRSQNWATFAHGYNGSDFIKNKYDERLAAAHAKYKIMPPRFSLTGRAAALLYLEFNPGVVDGVIGRPHENGINGLSREIWFARKQETSILRPRKSCLTRHSKVQVVVTTVEMQGGNREVSLKKAHSKCTTAGIRTSKVDRSTILFMPEISMLHYGDEFRVCPTLPYHRTQLPRSDNGFIVA